MSASAEIKKKLCRVRYLGAQENVGGRPPVEMFNVLSPEDLKGSTVTLDSLRKKGFTVEIVPACADLKSPLEKFDEAMMAAADMAAEGDWNLTVTALDAALHEARLLAKKTDEAGVVKT